MRTRSVLKYVLGGTIGAAVPALVLAGSAFADETDDKISAAVQPLTESTNLLWVVIGAILVIFMQAGFCLLYTSRCV